MAVAAPRRVRSGSLSSGEDSYSDEEDSRKMKSYVTQAPSGPAVVDRKSSSPRNRGTPSSGGSPPRRKKPRFEDTPPRRKHRRRRSSSPEESDQEDGATRSSAKESKEREEEPAPKRKKEEVDPILTRTGGAYIPPARLRMMQQSITDKSSVAYQRLAWEALKKSINGLINKVNVANIGNIVGELFQENVVRGRGLLARSIIQAQAASPVFTHVYAALVAVINTKFPQTGELIAKRLVSQFRKGYRRNDKNTCVTAIKFIGHLVNQQVLHEIVALEALTLLLEDPTDDSVEVAVGFLKEVGLKLIEVSPRGIHAVFETLRSVLHSGKIAPRVQYMIEVMFAIRKDQFKDHPSVVEELDLVQEDDQITHLLSLDDEFDTEEALNVFHPDPDFLANEDKYKIIKDEILGEGSDSEEGSGSSGEESSEEEDSEGEEGAEGEEGGGMDITDKTDSKVLGIRRTIYLTIMSSLDFEECAHKLIKSLVEGMEGEVAYMLIECCSQERSYLRFYGLLGQRLCLLNQIWVEKFDEAFQQQYSTVHRLETNKLRNVAKFFGQLFYADALPWTCMSCIHLNEEETNSSSRIFVKILFQELAEFMGLTKLNQRLRDPLLAVAFEGLLPRDNPKNTRFAINFFTSIGLGGLTDDLREHLKNAQKLIMAQRQEVSSSDTDSSSEEEDSSSSEEDSSSESEESSESSEEEKKRRKKRKRTSKERSSRDEEKKKERSRGSSRSEKAGRRGGVSDEREEEHSERRDKGRDNGRARGRRERHELGSDDERRQDRDSEERDKERSRRRDKVRDSGRARERRGRRESGSDGERRQDRDSEEQEKERSRRRDKIRDSGRARERRGRHESGSDDERRQDRDSEEQEKERSHRRDKVRDSGRARERRGRHESDSDDERRQDRDSEERENERSRGRDKVRDSGRARERRERHESSSDEERRQDRDSEEEEEEDFRRRDRSPDNGRARGRRERHESSSDDERRQDRDSEEREEERSGRRDKGRDNGRARERRERRMSGSDDERRQDRERDRHDRKRKEESSERKNRGRERREADGRGERDKARGSPREDKRYRRESSEERDRERGRNRERGRDRDSRRRDERR